MWRGWDCHSSWVSSCSLLGDSRASWGCHRISWCPPGPGLPSQCLQMRWSWNDSRHSLPPSLPAYFLMFLISSAPPRVSPCSQTRARSAVITSSTWPGFFFFSMSWSCTGFKNKKSDLILSIWFIYLLIAVIREFPLNRFIEPRQVILNMGSNTLLYWTSAVIHIYIEYKQLFTFLFNHFDLNWTLTNFRHRTRGLTDLTDWTVLLLKSSVLNWTLVGDLMPVFNAIHSHLG